MRLPPPNPLTITCTWIAAIFMAVEQGLRGLPAMNVNGWWNFIPVAVLGFGFLVWLVRAFAHSADPVVTAQPALESELQSGLLNPPARDPDGIYQHGRKVGQVTGAVVDLGRSEVRFLRLDGDGNFDASREFEYREHVLRVVGRASGGQVSMAGVISHHFNDAVCEVIRAR